MLYSFIMLGNAGCISSTVSVPSPGLHEIPEGVFQSHKPSHPTPQSKAPSTANQTMSGMASHSKAVQQPDHSTTETLSLNPKQNTLGPRASNVKALEL